MKTNKTLLTAAVAGLGLGLGLAGTAQAKSINEVLAEVAGLGGNVGTPASYNLRDADRSVIYQGSEDGQLNVGDIIRGTFVIHDIRSPEVSVEQPGYNSMFGRFSLAVTNIDSTGNVSFGADGSLGTNVMFEFWESATQTIDLDAATVANGGGFDFGIFGSSDASLWGAAGFGSDQSASYEYTLNFGDYVANDGGDYYIDLLAILNNATIGEAVTNGSLVQLDWLDGTVLDGGLIQDVGRFGANKGFANVWSDNATIYFGKDGVFTSSADRKSVV